MTSEKTMRIKKFLNRAIFLGVIGMALAFLVAVNSPKKYLIVGKVVVFPSGSGSAQQNLGYEVGNTVQIINSSAFKTNAFQGASGNFAYAKQLGNSSTIVVAFFAEKNQQTKVEDSIVSIPMSLAEYSRDLYSGSPFKYKLLSDPEISTAPAQPNFANYLSLGFGIGILAYVIYWFLFEFLRIPAEKETAASEIISPKLELVETAEPAEKKIGGGKVVMENGRPSFVPGKSENAKSSAPENLPFVDESSSNPSVDLQEPSDEEVKERLNRLMRGEL